MSNGNGDDINGQAPPTQRDQAQIMSQMLAYLNGGSFTFFSNSDVTNYPQQDQIWVNMGTGNGEDTIRAVYDYGIYTNTLEGLEDIPTPVPDFYIETSTIAKQYAQIIVDNTTHDPE